LRGAHSAETGREGSPSKQDRVVFITGASGGLGTSVRNAFLRQGARVIGASLHIKETDFPQPNFEAMTLDFNKLDESKRGVAKSVERYGLLDVLVHVLGGFAGGPSVAETP
jgi:NAD(P)-dependent dehydrogenase (short-subunit alcohol dehydrogenase family)